MNNERRSELSKLVNILEDIGDRIEAITEAEAEAFENMPESFQEGERGDKAQEAITAMEDAFQQLEEVRYSLENADATFAQLATIVAFGEILARWPN